MKVTPLDLKKAEFKRVLRGYHPGDVSELLAAAAESLEELVRENRSLKEKQNMLGERLKSYESMEKTLNDTLITAQKSGDATRQVADREAELIVAKAEVQAEKLVEAAKSELKRTRYQIEMLEHEKEAFLVKMRSMVASQWKILQEDFEPRRTVVDQPAENNVQPLADEQAVPGELETVTAEELSDVTSLPEENNGQPVDDSGVGDLSGQLGKILGSSGDAAADEGKENDNFLHAGDIADVDESAQGAGDTGQQPGDDKPEVFWGDDAQDEGLEAGKENK